MSAKTFNFEPFKAGDTKKAFTVTATNPTTGEPIAIQSARAKIFEKGSRAVRHAFQVTVSGAGSNVMTISKISAAESTAIGPGVFYWELEVTKSDGDVITWLGGKVPVTIDNVV